MVIVKLMGGLGNQMFQYAAGRALAERLNTRLYMDPSWFDIAYTTDTLRVYELDCYKVIENFKPVNRLTLIENYVPTLKSHVYRATKGLRRPYAVHFIEQGHKYNNRIESLEGNIYIDGWWQSEKYFKDFRTIILRDFAYKKPPSNINAKRIKDIEKTNAISLHVRRGDYAHNKNTQAFHGLMGLDYYKVAVDKMAKRVKDPHFFVFSDEPEWCQENLKINYPTTYITGNKDGSEDMRLMRRCKHNIIANSSFSWWGAWLNTNPDKMIIAPKQWFKDASANSTDTVAKDWIKL